MATPSDIKLLFQGGVPDARKIRGAFCGAADGAEAPLESGESLHTIGRVFDKPHTSIRCLLSHHGGIVPAVRRRSVPVLTAIEREDISPGLASGSSIREITRRDVK
jgi:hypothetical protein